MFQKEFGKQGKKKDANNAFVSPEMIFTNFNEHTPALDVWGFGMVMFCILFGKVPDSFYQVYKDWLKICHNQDIETASESKAFIPPNSDSFIYDPFSSNSKGG